MKPKKNDSAVSAYMSRIGRKGGLKSSSAKTAAAKIGALKRWGKPIPQELLDRVKPGRTR